MKFVHCKSALTSNDLSKEVVGTLYELGFALKIFLRQDNDVNGSVCAIVNHLYSVILKLSEKSFYINWDNHRFNPAISASNKIRLWEVLKLKKWKNLDSLIFPPFAQNTCDKLWKNILKIKTWQNFLLFSYKMGNYTWWFRCFWRSSATYSRKFWEIYLRDAK